MRVSRRLFLRVSSVLCAATGGGFLASRYFSKDEPSDRPEEFGPPSSPPTPPAGELRHIAIDENALRASYARQARDAFQVAVESRVLPKISLACETTGVPMDNFMPLPFLESRFGQQRVVRTTANSAPQTASGLMQITDGTFLYYAARYTDKHQGLIATHGGEAGRALLDVRDFLRTGSDYTLNRGAYETFRQNRIAEALRRLPAKIRTTARAIRSVTATITRRFGEDLKAQALQGRNSDVIALLFSAAYVAERRERIPAAVRDELKGAECNFIHLFGGRGSEMVINAWKKTPDMPMVDVFNLRGVEETDSRWDKLRNNRIPADMRVDDYVRQSTIIYDCVRGTLAECYQAYQAAPRAAPPSRGRRGILRVAADTPRRAPP